MSSNVRIRGLRELQSAFRAVDADMPKALRLEFKSIAEMVTGRVRGKVPQISGEAAGSVKPRATQKGAGIAYPGGGDRSKAAYYPWLDFGGSVGRAKGIHRPIIKTGRYIYPTIAESSTDIGEAAEAAVTKVARSHSFEVRGL